MFSIIIQYKLEQVKEFGPAGIVVGSAIVEADNPAEAAAFFKERIA